MKTSLLYRLFAVAIVALTGCRSGTLVRAENRPAIPAQMVVSVASARERTLRRVSEGQGALFPKEKTELAAEVTGRVEEVKADFGDAVSAGQVLLVLDRREYQLKVDSAQAALAQAKARLTNASAEFSRSQELRREKMVSAAQFDQISANLKMAQADADAAQKALELTDKKLADTEVTAPFGGFVQRRMVSMGQFVNAGEKLYELVAVDPIKLRAPVPERYVPLARVGLQVELTVDAHPGKVFKGSITRIAPALDDASRTLLVEAEVANSDGSLRPGYFAHIRVDFGEDRAIFVPQAAVVRYAGVERVFVIKDGIAHSREVVSGAVAGDQVEISKGLESGEQVAVSEIDRLADGSPVLPKVQS